MKQLLAKIGYWCLDKAGRIPPANQIEDKFGFKVNEFKTVYVKKGKIREWRTYDKFGNRITPVLK